METRPAPTAQAAKQYLENETINEPCQPNARAQVKRIQGRVVKPPIPQNRARHLQNIYKTKPCPEITSRESITK